MRPNEDDRSNAESRETLRGELAGGVVRGGGDPISSLRWTSKSTSKLGKRRAWDHLGEKG